jgi:hypothetical protein
MAKPKLTPTPVKIHLASGKVTSGIRHKNLTPAPGPGTPSAGPVAESPIAPEATAETLSDKVPVYYANVMGSFTTTSVFDDEEADEICAETHHETLESLDAWGETVSVDVEWRPLQVPSDGWTLINGVEVAYTEDEPPVGLRSTNSGGVELVYHPYSIPQGASYADEVDSEGDDELRQGEYRITSVVNLS